MKTTLNQQAKELCVANAIASLRIEGMTPSAELQKELKAYAAGNKTINELVEQIKQRYVSLPRG